RSRPRAFRRRPPPPPAPLHPPPAAAPHPPRPPDRALDNPASPSIGAVRPTNARPWCVVSAPVFHDAQEVGMRALVTLAVLACALAAALCPSAALAQGLSAEEAQTLRDEIRRLNE